MQGERQVGWGPGPRLHTHKNCGGKIIAPNQEAHGPSKSWTAAKQQSSSAASGPGACPPCPCNSGYPQQPGPGLGRLQLPSAVDIT